MKIAGDREIGAGSQPYLVAELAGEHRGSLSAAEYLICAAAEAGFDAVKLQCFVPQRLAEARGGADKVITEGIWKGRRLGELYLETCTPRAWFPRLFDLAREMGITLFSSVFDENDVVFLEHFDCPAYKIASFENRALGLIRKAASTGKPLIISTGMASDVDVMKALEATAPLPSKQLGLLHCVSGYPCPIEEASLSWITGFLKAWPWMPVGLSDHTLGNTAAIVATALGASIIEKHITLDRKNGGPDASFSLEPSEFTRFVQDVRDAYASLRTGERPESEAPYRELRRKSC